MKRGLASGYGKSVAFVAQAIDSECPQQPTFPTPCSTCQEPRCSSVTLKTPAKVLFFSIPLSALC